MITLDPYENLNHAKKAFFNERRVHKLLEIFCLVVGAIFIPQEDGIGSVKWIVINSLLYDTFAYQGQII